MFHPFHIVSFSPWPVVVSLEVLVVAVSLVGWLHGFENGGLLVALGLMVLITTVSVWFRDINRESIFFGSHPSEVLRGLRVGFIWFVISEIMLFGSLFWAFIFLGISPVIFIGSYWPLWGINLINPLGVPLFGTFILLASSISVTSYHHLLTLGRSYSFVPLVITCLLGLSFSLLQVLEYLELPFSWADGSAGGVFYLTTGLHGIHVIIGSLALITSSVLISNSFLSRGILTNIGTDLSILYWHFVDYVWLIVFSLFYLWVN